jgi:methionyl-tRNA formyltransferase
MNVVFIGKSHAFSKIPLNGIMEAHRITGIVESGPRGNSKQPTTKNAPLAARWKSFFRPSYSPLEKIAKRIKVPHMHIFRENRDSLRSFVESANPDIICVASLSQLLKKDVFEFPKHGALNLHPSMLPKYPGAFPWFWQYHAFEKEIGVTVHVIDEGEDTGPIVKQEAFPLELGTDVVEAMEIAASIGARLMVEALHEIEAGTVTYRPQSPGRYPRARIVKRDEQLLDWSWPIERVWHFMRGTYPWLDFVQYPAKITGKSKIGTFERCAHGIASGQVCQDEKGYYVSHAEGKIRLDLRSIRPHRK